MSLTTSYQVIQLLLRMLTATSSEAQPESDEAQRVLHFFMSSLSNRQLCKPGPLVRGWVEWGASEAGWGCGVGKGSRGSTCAALNHKQPAQQAAVQAWTTG